MLVWGGLKEKLKDIPIWIQSSKEQQVRDKKVFLSDQCKEIEENNRMGETRDFFKKIRDTNISWKDRHNKEQKWYGPNRSN